MNFVAEHMSFQHLDGVSAFALSDSADLQPQEFVILTFGEEDDQDRELGLTGLYIEASDGTAGYGLVEQLRLDSSSLLIELVDDLPTICVDVSGYDKEVAQIAITACNHANETRPRKIT